MKFKLGVICLAIALIVGGIGCTAGQLAIVTEVDNIVAMALPFAETAANILIGIEAPQVAVLAQAVETKVNAGFALIQSEVAALSATNGATVAKQVAATAAVLQADINQLNTLANVSPAEQSVVKQLTTQLNSAIQEIVAALPAPNASMKATAGAKVKIGGVIVNYKRNYNRIVRTKTGDVGVDALLAKAKLFRHKVLGVGTLAY